MCFNIAWIFGLSRNKTTTILSVPEKQHQPEEDEEAPFVEAFAALELDPELDPWHESLETDFFTQDELLYALDGIGFDNDDEVYNPIEPPALSTSPLPVFPVRWNDENDSLLDSETGSEDWLDPSTTTDLAEAAEVDPSILDPSEGVLDQVALSLLEQLGSLSLQQQPHIMNHKNPGDEQDDSHFNMINVLQEEEPLPPYMYCQPCDDEFDLPGIETTEVDWTNEEQGEDPSRSVYSFQPRPEALEAADVFVKTMSPLKSTNTPRNERSCLGHKQRILGLDLSECGNFMATASEDSTVKIWNVQTNRLLATLDHNKKFECLRAIWAPRTWREEERDRDDNSLDYLLATGSADGFVCLYSCSDPLTKPWVLQAQIDHSQLSHFAPSEDPDDKPQVYSLQFIDEWKGLGGGEQNSFLLTSSDDHVHLWEWDMLKKVKLESGTSETRVDFREVISIHFSDLHGHGYGVRVGQVSNSGMFSLPPTVARDEKRDITNDTMPAEDTFGGDRNPNGLTFVFDAQYNAASGYLGVALSDGSLRILNGRGVCLSVLQLPGINSHLTSFAWDRAGRRLATCVASGHIITWNLESYGSDVRASCVAIFERGHEAGRPLFGARYVESNQNAEEILLSWGVDGRLCLWDACAAGEAHGPLAILLTKQSYPIYSVCLRAIHIAVGGGNGENDFIGVPVYLYDIEAPAHVDASAIR